MKITAITKFKHGDLYAILKRLGWTQSRLAEESGIHPCRIGHIINLIRRPTKAQAEAIQLALGRAGEYLDILSTWPESFSGTGRSLLLERTEEIPEERLLDHPEVMELPAPDPYDEVFDQTLDEVLKTLPSKHEAIVRGRMEGKTFEELGRQYGMSKQSADILYRAALRKLRHPVRVRKLMPLLYSEI